GGTADRHRPARARDRNGLPCRRRWIRAGEGHHRPPRRRLLDARLCARGPFHELGLAWAVVRRTLTLTLVIITAILLQTTVFADVRLLGAKPELLYLVTIVIALLEGSASGAITGFACGMAQD